MSKILLELLGLATATTHTIELNLPRVELRLELTDPRTNKPMTLPPGPLVSLVDRTGVVVDRAAIEGDGCVHLLGVLEAADVRLEIDYSGREWLDVGASVWVSEKDVQSGDERALLRMPRRWRSDEQNSFSDDRGGAFALGTFAALTDGANGTVDTPWVLRIDHAWPRFLLELRYTNTHHRKQQALPPGPLVEVAYEAGAPKLRLAGASTVLDRTGLVALWIFDRKAPLGDLRVLLRSPVDSFIEMDGPEPGTITKVSPAKHDTMLPKARARLHPLAKLLRLHEQPGEQGGQRGVLAKLLPTAAQMPARIRVPIDVLVELRLVLHNPVTGSPMPIPAGVEVVLTDARNASLTAARTAEDGRVSLFAPPGSRDIGIEIAFADAPYLDLVAATFAAAADAEPNTTRRLVRLPDRWRSIEQSRLSDDRGGKLTKGRTAALAAGEFGTLDQPWELDLGHAWQRTELVFQYYDVTALAVRPVVFGPLVEAFDDVRLRDRDRVAASTILDATGRVYLMFFRAVDPEKLRLRLRTAIGSAVVTGEADPELRVRVLGDAALAALPLDERQRHYRLPSVWLSRGQACRAANGTSAAALPFEDAIGKAVNTAVAPPRLHFDLDDFVLVNAFGVPLGFVRALDLTIFHHDMSIRAAKTATPYFSGISGEINHFSGSEGFYTVGKGAEQTARVVRRGKTFYDLTDQRTLRGRIVGARAAVAENHPHERIFLKHQPGTSPNLANCDLHYFEDVAADPTAPGRSISVLMVFFSVRIRNLVIPKPKAVIPDPKAALQDALARAAERWSGAALAGALAGVTPDIPDVRLRTDDALHDVKFVFHFPAFDDREGHAVIWIRPNPRAFSLSTFGLMVIDDLDTQAKPLGAPLTLSDIEYGHGYKNETVAHEIGHSMGLGDEYFESLKTTTIPKLAQFPWDFLHLSFDPLSMMNGERGPRLRHYWVFSRWLERSADIARIQPGGYAIACDTAAVTAPIKGRKHALRLPPEHNWPYASARDEKRFRPGVNGRGRLGLFLLGDDFDAFVRPASGVVSGIDAVLHWDLSIYVRSRQNAEGTSLTATDRRLCVESLYRCIVPATTHSGSGRLVVAELEPAAAATPLAQRHAAKVLIYVLPRFTFSNPAAADFRLHVRPRSGVAGADITDLHRPTFLGRKLEIHNEVPSEAVIRYMMGVGAADAHPGATITIATTPLPIGPSFAIGTNNVAAKTLRVVHGSRTSGANDFDGSGSPAQVAADLAAAVNDPHNRYAAHVAATPHANVLSLLGRPAGADVLLSAAPPGTSIRDEWRGLLEATEFDPLADWLGQQLGATYRIKVYV